MFKKVALGALVAGAVTLGSFGIADAASSTQTGSSAPTTTAPAAVTPHVGKTLNCANAPKYLALIQKYQGDISAGLPKLTAAEAKATANGHPKRAARIDKLIKRLEGPNAQSALTKIEAKINAKCPAPTTGS